MEKDLEVDDPSKCVSAERERQQPASDSGMKVEMSAGAAASEVIGLKETVKRGKKDNL